MRVHRSKVRLSALLALALLAAACSGSDGDGTPAPDSGARNGGSFAVAVTDPGNPLIPSDTNGSDGGAIIDALFTGLVVYDAPSSGLAFDGVAQSITSDDATTWTVVLKDWKFHDGTPVTSDSYLKAWNYAANSSNAQANSYFFSNVVGYTDLQGRGAAAPPETQMSGLRKIDDKTFTVTLTSPFRQYPLTTVHPAVLPLPDSFFADKPAREAFGRKPIGNGPFKADGEFVKGKGIVMSRFEDHPGEKARADKVEFRVYADQSSAYQDLRAGNVDIATVPPSAVITFKDEFGERALEWASSSFTYLAFPTYDGRFQDSKVRQAFSMGVDRKAIAESVFHGSKIPAFSVVSPVAYGSRTDTCTFCQYKPDKAKKLLTETGFDTRRPVELWFNAEGGHDEWVRAVGNNLRDNLGISVTLRGDLTFAKYLLKGDAETFTGPFHLAWQADHPSPQNYLEPLYTSSQRPPNGSNVSFYSNRAFDDLIDRGNEAKDNDAAVKAYQDAEDVLLTDMPIMPMFFGRVQTATSDRVGNVMVDASTHVRVADVVVRQ